MQRVDIEKLKGCGKFAVILKCLLAKNNMTQCELAQKTGLSIATISHYAKGRSTPSKRTLEKVASALNVQLSTFYGDVEDYEHYLSSEIDYFAERMNQLLKEKGITQAQFANDIGVSRQSANYYMKGKMFPEFDKVIEIARYFNVSLESLLEAPNKLEETGKMKLRVINMPKKKNQCMFVTAKLNDEHYECKISGAPCDLCDGKCSQLTEV